MQSRPRPTQFAGHRIGRRPPTGRTDRGAGQARSIYRKSTVNQTRRRLLAGAPALADAGCAAIANTTTSPSTAVASAAATVNAGASSLWGIALGIGQEALTVLDVADPPLAAAVNGIIALGTSALTVVQSATSSATQVARRIGRPRDACQQPDPANRASDHGDAPTRGPEGPSAAVRRSDVSLQRVRGTASRCKPAAAAKSVPRNACR